MAANGNISNPDQHSPKSAGETNSKAEENAPIVNRIGLQKLVHDIDPSLWLDEDVAQVILYMADEFVESSMSSACRIAQKRGSSTVEVKDVLRLVKKQWNINVPICDNSVEERNSPENRSAMTEAHLQTLARMRKIFQPK